MSAHFTVAYRTRKCSTTSHGPCRRVLLLWQVLIAKIFGKTFIRRSGAIDTHRMWMRVTQARAARAQVKRVYERDVEIWIPGIRWRAGVFLLRTRSRGFATEWMSRMFVYDDLCTDCDLPQVVGGRAREGVGAKEILLSSLRETRKWWCNWALCQIATVCFRKLLH